MTVFDLLFLAIFAATVVALIVAAVLAIRGRFAETVRLLRSWGIGIGVYLGVAFTINALLPQKELRMGEDLCFDDWCIAATKSSVAESPEGPRYTVDFRVRSRARRVDQRFNGMRVQLVDARGRDFEPIADSSGVPFNTLLHPGESAAATRRFQGLKDSGRAGVEFRGSGPGWVIIGEGALKPPVVWLE